MVSKRKVDDAKYVLWSIKGGITQPHVCETVDDARSLWIDAKLEKWEGWELREHGVIIKKGIMVV